MRMSARWTTPLLAIALASVAGCDEAPPAADPADVYVVGWESEGGDDFATLWKNGVPQRLSESPSVATAIAVAGEDVFVTGCVYDVGPPASNVATVWRNGVPQALTDGTWPACAEDVAVSGSDVYVAGTEYSVPRLWKNGVREELPYDPRGGAGAVAVAVAGGDVYVAGYAIEETELAPGRLRIGPVAKLWKNGGAPVSLSDGRTAAEAFAVAVDGPDVFVAGYVAVDCTAPCSAPNVATIWKNGVPAALTDGALGAAATSVAVAGGKVYATGGLSDGAVYSPALWTDGVAARLGDGARTGEGRDVVVSGDAVYVAGFDGPGARYWRNGVAVPLSAPGTGGIATGIAVVAR